MKRTPAGEALAQVFIEMAPIFFRLRALGKTTGLVTPWGGGIWGFLRSLKIEGPQTVPQLARARPVARQRIQRLADEAAAAGLIEFVDNPAHKRSKLLRLTARGEQTFDDLDARMGALADDLARGLDEKDLRTAARVLKQLRERLQEG